MVGVFVMETIDAAVADSGIAIRVSRRCWQFLLSAVEDLERSIIIPIPR